MPETGLRFTTEMKDQALTAEHAEHAETEKPGKRIQGFFPRGPRVLRFNFGAFQIIKPATAV